MTEDFEMAVIAVVSSLERGDAATYGDVAAEAGYPGAARAVGNLLRTTAVDIPWWRVVGSGGRITSPNPTAQRELLMADGWIVRDRRLVGFGKGERREARREKPETTHG